MIWNHLRIVPDISLNLFPVQDQCEVGCLSLLSWWLSCSSDGVIFTLFPQYSLVYLLQLFPFLLGGFDFCCLPLGEFPTWRLFFPCRFHRFASHLIFGTVFIGCAFFFVSIRFPFFCFLFLLVLDFFIGFTLIDGSLELVLVWEHYFVWLLPRLGFLFRSRLPFRWPSCFRTT